MQRPSQELMDEWFESSVTKYFVKQFEDRIKRLDDVGTTDVFHPFDPQKTQEILAGINAAIDVWEEVVEALSGEEWYDYSEDAGNDE